ncbi:hypothetical protein CVT24_005350 [Panaeolus cyanescens]|uniref:DUF1751-domain-containing protein n=1 Tax=Panaeolus cyanescens TaxID=181874 RepID=A0A409Y8X7_9AGAR|nr:hypothetical protein CVT24_005350 [Panaeolus cyanescens]
MAILSSPLQVVLSVPPVTRAYTAASILSSALYAYLCWRGLRTEALQYMTMLPGYTIYAPWTIFTSSLVDISIWGLLATLIFVPAALKYLERLWGSLETIKFIVVSIVASNIIAFGFNWIEWAATRNADLFLYGMPYHGQMAIQIAILVAFTQLIPEHQIQILGMFKVRVKSLPMAHLTISTVMCFIGFQCPWIIIQFGWFVSWVYLRFYKKHSSDAIGGMVTYGDRSDTFSLVSWFPPFMHGPLTILGNFVFGLATRLHLIPSSASGDPELGGYTQVPGNARAEAERRRAMALKALDQRVANNSSPVASNTSNSGPSHSRAPTVTGGARSDVANGGPVAVPNGRQTEADNVPESK